ncbi:MAG: sulfatase-like hydrolase/transferase, partial [Verrucomicrobiia bacterium]
MNYQRLTRLCIACCGLLLESISAQTSSAKADSRPNIIVIMSDDHAYQAISAYGHGLNETPHIDRLAQEGALFTRASVTNSICAPSRAVML